MKRLCFVLALAGVFAAPHSLYGQEDPNVQIMKKLYSKIAGIVRAGANDPVYGTNFLVMLNPGIPLDPNINTNTTAGLYAITRQIDNVILPQFMYAKSADTTYKVYRDILNFRRLPTITPSPDEKKAYEAARKKIFSDAEGKVHTPAYERFKEKQLAYARAQDKIITFQNGNPYADVPNVYWVELEQAEKDFQLVGDADELIAAYEVVRSYTRLDPNVWWGELRDVFRRGTRQFQGQDFGLYNFYPQYPVWLDPKQTWGAYKLADTDIQQTTTSSHTSSGGGFSAGWGFWSVGANTGSMEDRNTFKLDAKSYSLTFDLARVDIDRPFLEYSVFESRAWKWSKSSPRQKVISDGANAFAGAAPDGIMPFLPVGILLARNVTISGDWQDKFEDTIKKQSSSGGSIGFGPFSFGYSTSSSSSEDYRKYKLSGSSLTFTSPQIIGFFVQVLPRSPFPDEDAYHWPAEVAPLTDQINSALADKQRLFDQAKQLRENRQKAAALKKQ